MGDYAIKVEQVSKRYRLGTGVASSLSEALGGVLRRPGATAAEQAFWALRDVSFTVRPGEIVGLIGRNGAGKSTLLKILSRITAPTTGQVRVRGRVGSLLEVGTGFHPELTGRENIYLNGTILGMSRAEIDRKFDEIVEFAELQRFLDTPVKRYSSGMYTRLAFSISAHLEPEVLIIDEVLAVGDSAFQRRCLERVSLLARGGHTILLVSHSMSLVQMLCSRAVVLRLGEVVADDTAPAAVATYLRMLEEYEGQSIAERTDRAGAGDVRLTHIDIAVPGGQVGQSLASGAPASFTFRVSGLRPGLTCSFTLYDHLGNPVTFFDSALSSPADSVDPASPAFRCAVDELPLLPGRYRLNAALTCDGKLQDHVEAAAYIEVEHGRVRGRLVPGEPGYGSVFVPHSWSLPGRSGR